MIFMLPITMFATTGSTTYTVSLHRTVKKEHNQELDREGIRMPPRPMLCTISEQGIQTEIPSEDIISYELLDDTGSCLVSFADDKEFVQFLYSYGQNEFQIRITTEEYHYIGYISTL